VVRLVGAPQEWGPVNISICEQALQIASISSTFTTADCFSVIIGFHVPSRAFQHRQEGPD
jgi:hypothetical protein